MIFTGVVTHSARRDQAMALAEHAGAQAICIDDGNLGHNANHRRVWSQLLTFPFNTGWSVVLEDDAILADDWNNQLAQVLQAAPTPIVSLYTGRLRPPQWQRPLDRALKKLDRDDAHFITSGHLINAVATAMRSSLVEDMLLSVRRHQPWDEAMSAWAQQRGHEIAYCIPSIVEHADGSTLIQHQDGKRRVPGRVAHRFGTRPDWSSKSVPM